MEGRLDAATAPAAQESFLRVAGEYSSIVLDFENLAYVSSAGLRALLAMQKAVNKAAGHMHLVHVQPEIVEVLDMTGFSGILDVR